MKIEIATSIDELDLTKWDTRRIAYLAAAVSVVVSVVLSLHLIYKHLRNYTRPKLQRCIVRIILMVPVRFLSSPTPTSSPSPLHTCFCIHMKYLIIRIRIRIVDVQLMATGLTQSPASCPDLFAVQLVLSDVPRPRQHHRPFPRLVRASLALPLSSLSVGLLTPPPCCACLHHSSYEAFLLYQVRTHATRTTRNTARF